MKILTLNKQRYAVLFAVDVYVNGIVTPVLFTTRKSAQAYKTIHDNDKVMRSISNIYACLRWISKAF